MKKQARIDVRDYLDLNTSGTDLQGRIARNAEGLVRSLSNGLSPEGKEMADAMTSITGDTTGAVRKAPMKIKGLGDLQKVIDVYNQYYPEMNTQVQLGMVDSARNKARAEALKPGLFSKLWGKLTLDETFGELIEKSRADHFSPVSNTVHVFSENPSILAHELGHAADFTYRHKNSPGRMMGESALLNILSPFVGVGTLDDEFAATNNAWKALSQSEKGKELLKNLSRDLSGAGGTYVGSSIGGAIGAAAGIGGALTGSSDPVFIPIMHNGGKELGQRLGAATGREAGKFIDIPKYLMSATLPEPKPVSDRLKMHAADILNDLKSGNILKYPRDSFNSAKYVFNDIKEMAKAKLLALAKHFK